MLTPVPVLWTVPEWIEIPKNSSNATAKFNLNRLLTNQTANEDLEGFLALAQSGLLTHLALDVLNIFIFVVSLAA